MAYDAWVRDEARFAVLHAWWSEICEGVGPSLPTDAECAAVDELLEGGGDLGGEVDADGAPDVWFVWKSDPRQALAHVRPRLVGSVRLTRELRRLAPLARQRTGTRARAVRPVRRTARTVGSRGDPSEPPPELDARRRAV